MAFLPEIDLHLLLVLNGPLLVPRTQRRGNPRKRRKRRRIKRASLMEEQRLQKGRERKAEEATETRGSRVPKPTKRESNWIKMANQSKSRVKPRVLRSRIIRGKPSTSSILSASELLENPRKQKESLPARNPYLIPFARFQEYQWISEPLTKKSQNG